MRNRKFKLLSLALVIVMALSIFAGCVSENTDKNESTVSNTSGSGIIIHPSESSKDDESNATSSEADSTDSSTTETETSDEPESSDTDETSEPDTDESTPEPSFSLDELSHELFDGENAFIILNDNVPFFTKDEITTASFESYGELDELGRCTVCFACVGIDLMPTEGRGSISSVYPSGWKYNGKSNNNQYDFVDGKYIYNRCHLIGFQLTGENANKQNLITGTRFLNIDGMLDFENMIADAVKEDGLHVMYRVTPVYDGDNLVAEGLLLEGYSVEDSGETIQFCVFSFNVQPGVTINYATGENEAA